MTQAHQKQGSIDLIWIVVADLKKAIQFYTEIVGFKVLEIQEQYGWAELGSDEKGTRLGIAQTSPENPLPPGSNAIVAVSTPDIDAAKAAMIEKGAKVLGDIQEVPGQVKMQLFEDADGNKMQLVQDISSCGCA